MLSRYLTLVFMFTFFGLQAQQEAHYTHFMFNQQWLNPGYIGSRGNNTLTGLYRQQWIGFEGAPTSQMLTFNGPIGDGRSALGVGLAHFGIGLLDNFYGNLGYSYAIVKTDKLQIRGGLQGVFRQVQINPNDPGIYVPNRNDPVIAGETFSRSTINFGAGLYAQADKWYAGVGLPSILEQPYSLSENADSAAWVTRRHIFGTVGGILDLNDKLKLRPAVMLKYVANAPIDADINVMLLYAMKYGFGVSYRLGGDGPGESIDALLHYQLNPKFALGVSYDYTLSMLRQVNSGSIELFARYEWGKNMGENLTNPRFFN